MIFITRVLCHQGSRSSKITPNPELLLGRETDGCSDTSVERTQIGGPVSYRKATSLKTNQMTCHNAPRMPMTY